MGTKPQITGELRQIPSARIRPNPDNPRVAFRQRELDELQESIRRYGVQVPIAVYKSGSDYVLIDGERRWRCSLKLNLPTIPALVREEPSALDNLLLMFNIHSLREQWDLLTIALKLPSVMGLLKKRLGKVPTEAELSSETGLARGVIRRCRILMDLPDKYKQLLLAEIKKPKSRQKLSEDFFIELEKALRTVERAMPGLITDKDAVRDLMINKYKSDVFKNITDLRLIPKIARAERVGGDVGQARSALKRLFSQPGSTIEEAFSSTVAAVYAERDLVSRIEGLTEKLSNAPEDFVDDDVREQLEKLVEAARLLLDAPQ